jgi:hypothetical protein
MIFIERAHKNIQNVFTLAWLEDDVYSRMIETVQGLSPVAVQYIGALVDTNTLPVRDAESLPGELSLEEYISLVQNKESLQLLPGKDMSGAIPNKEVLATPEMKKQILYTTYMLLEREESGIANGIISQLETVTKGTLAFGNDADTLLYRKIYLLLVFRYAKNMPPARLIEIFSSSLFSLAIFMELTMIPALEEHIRLYSLITTRENLTLDYAASIRNNNTPFGINKNKKSMTIKEWTEHWSTYLENVSQEEFFDKLEKDPELLANDKVIQPLIEMIAYIYRLLISGYFILEPGAKKSVDILAKELQKEAQQELLQRKRMSFPDQLAEHSGEIATWIDQTASLQALLSWLKTFESKQKARDAFVLLLQKHISDISEDMETASALIQIDGFLKQQGFTGKDLLFFDEQEGVFKFS